MKKIFSVVCASAILLNTLFVVAFDLPAAGMPEGFQMPAVMPDGLQIPEGLQLPEGLKIPEGLQIPDGIKIPDGFKLPEGMQIPEGMKIPEGVQIPEGLDANLIGTYLDMFKSKIPKNDELGIPDSFNLEEIIKSNPAEIESIITQNLFIEDKIGVVNIKEISSEEEKNKIKLYKIDTSTFEGKIENAVFEAFNEEIENILPGISKIILSEIEKKMDSILDVIMKKGITQIKVKTTATNEDFKKIPPEEVIKSIPAGMMASVSARVKLMVTEDVHNQMGKAVLETEKNTKMVIDACTGDIKEIIKGVVKNIVPQVAKSIQSTVDSKIEQKVLQAITESNIQENMPPEYIGLSKEEIVKKMYPSIADKVEKYIRPIALERIKISVDEMVAKSIQKPILEKMKPYFDDLTDARIEETIDRMPAYIEVIITKAFVTGLVKSNVGWVKNQIDAMVSNTNMNLTSELMEYIDDEITNETKIYFGNTKIESDAKPINVNNRLLLPFRAISEKLGAEVKWVPEKRQVQMKKDDKELILTLDSNIVTVNGKEVKIDVSPQISENRTMVPIRFIAETFGLKVDWESDWKMVTME